MGEISNVRLAYLIAKYPPDLGNNINMAARQAAVWHYSNGKNLSNPDATTQGAAIDSQVLAIYNALLTEVNAIDPNNPPGILRAGNLAMTIDPPTAINQLPAQSAHQITVTLTKGGFAVAGIPVQVTSTFGQVSQATVTTDANGQAKFTITSNLPGTASITASAVVTVPTVGRICGADEPHHYAALWHSQLDGANR